jgi:hypothetical protein
MTTETQAASPGAAESAPSTDEILIRLLTGAWGTQAVATAARLGIPEILAERPGTADEVAAKADTHPGATYRLLRALASLGVLERRRDGRFANTAVGERFRAGVPGNLKDLFIAETDRVHWHSWEKAVDAVRTGQPQPKPVFGLAAFEYYTRHRHEGEQFGKAMENVSGFAAQAVLEAYDFSGVETIMDVGGGNGSLALLILSKHPGMKGKVFDLPYIEGQAKLGIQAAGAAHRCEFHAGDFFQEVPKGADLHTLKFILHDWNDEECVRILRACRTALPQEGKLLIIEMLTGGRERTAKEFEAILDAAGFAMTRVVPTKSPFSLVEARPK